MPGNPGKPAAPGSPRSPFSGSRGDRPANETSMTVLLIVGPKCTLAASHAVSHAEYATRIDRQTVGRHTPDRYITLSARSSQRNYTR